MKQLHLIVSGNVQGVGFRYYAQMVATSQQIKGWVRNRADGSVEIIAEGKKERIKSFLDSIKKGSPFSTVDTVDITEQDTLNNFQSFTIKY